MPVPRDSATPPPLLPGTSLPAPAAPTHRGPLARGDESVTLLGSELCAHPPITAGHGFPHPTVARALRVRAGYRRAEWASLLGVDHSMLARWEEGRTVPDLPNRTAYAALLERARGEVCALVAAGVLS